MTQYYLQKRTLSSWSHVTTYEDKEEGLKNLNKVYQDSGYSWRLVEAKVVEERLLTDEMKEQREEREVELYPHQQKALDKLNETPAQSWPVVVKPQANGGWTKPEQQTTWGTPPAVVPTHGLVGSVWLGNPTTKEKKRVPAAEADAMLASGWVKSGPRSVL